MQRPKLRDNKGKDPYEPYPLGQIPNNVIYSIGKWMTYYFAVGKSDISGEDWGDVFAKSVDGEHLNSPIGLADVILDGMGWSAKSIKVENPHLAKRIRVISGRCSPDYSYNISDPHEDIEKTGLAVISIWNERINIAKERFEPLRTAILVRNFTKMEFLLFEYEAKRYTAKDFRWEENKNGILEGVDILTGQHTFSWQPHGSQFTIIYSIPPSAIKFTVKRPPVLEFDKTMAEIGFEESWVTIL